MNNGYKKYTTLIQVNSITGVPTGLSKPNYPLDPNYIEPVFDTNTCPMSTTTTTTSTSTSTTTTTTKIKELVPRLYSILNTENTDTKLRIETFEVGDEVPINATYKLNCYEHSISVVSVLGDTTESIVSKLVDKINITTEAEWNKEGSTPVSGDIGFPPIAEIDSNPINFKVTYGIEFEILVEAYL